MKQLFFYLVCSSMSFGVISAMDVEQEQKELSNPMTISRRAAQEGIDISFNRAFKIADMWLLGRFGITDPDMLLEVATMNNEVVIDLTLEEAREIIAKTNFMDLTTPEAVINRAIERGIPITVEDAERYAAREALIDSFITMTTPADIKRHALEIGKSLTDEQAQDLAADLFERRLVLNLPH